MKKIKSIVLFFAIFTISCASKPEIKTETSKADLMDCTLESTQKLLSFCASPNAAALARRNAEIKNASKFEKAFSPIPIRNSPQRGPSDALVSVVIFVDLQCPYCKGAYLMMQEFVKEKGIRLIFKHAPMQSHALALPSALAVIAASEQNKFWEFADLVFEKQNELSLSSLGDISKELKLDHKKWKDDFGNEKGISIVENEIVLSRSLGIDATPTIFINGVRVVGLYSKNEFSKIIDEQENFAKELLDAGVERNDIYWRMFSVNYEKEEGVEEEAEKEISVRDVPVGKAPVRGALAKDALVTIVEFSDFECPFCRSASLWMRDFLKKNASDTRLAFRHFPLPFHENADVAALASLVAHRHGKFWEYHDILFANQNHLEFEDLEKYALRLGISKRKFKRDFKDTKLTDYLSKDMELAHKIGVRGTPTYIVNGIVVFGLSNEGSFEALVQSQRKLAKKIAREKNLSGEALYRAIIEENKVRFGTEKVSRPPAQ